MGCGMARIAGTMFDMNSMARMASRDIGKPSQPGGMPWSSRSSPEQKPRPAPVRMTTQVSLSAPTRASASSSGGTVSKDSAFSRSWRSRLTTLTWSAGFSMVTYDIGAASQIAAAQVKVAGLAFVPPDGVLPRAHAGDAVVGVRGALRGLRGPDAARDAGAGADDQ